MPALSSPLSTPAGLPAINSAHIGKFGGLAMHFATLAALNTAVTAERTDGFWSNNQPMTVATEGVTRLWSVSLQHARTARLSEAILVILPADSNTILITTGAPGSGVGANGDVAIDRTGNAYYTKAAGAWALSGQLYIGSAAADNVLRSPAGSGGLTLARNGSNQLTSVQRAEGRTYALTYPDASTIVLTANDGAQVTLTVDGSGRLTGATGNFDWAGAGASPAPATPTLSGDIVVSAVSDSGYTFTWQAASGATAYESSINAGGSWREGVATSRTVTGRAKGTTDQLRVRALNGAGTGNVLSASVLVEAPLAAPFSSVTFTGEAGSGAAPQNVPNQIVEFALHGSGGNPLYQGLIYSAALGTEEAYLGKTAFKWSLMTGYNEPAYPGGSTTRAVVVQPQDDLTGLWGAGRIETLWLGWIGGAHPGLVDLCTERWLDGLYAWMDANQPNFSTTRRILTGGSMGGWGGMTYGARRPEKFAAMYLRMPRWRYCEPSGNIQLLTWGGSIPAIPVGSAPALTAASGGGSSATHLDLITYVQDTSKRLPWIGWTIGRQDGYSPFTDHVAAVVAMRAAKRGFAFAWNNGLHGQDPSMNDIYASYPKGLFALNKGYPLFTDHSLDADPAVDLVGGINMGLSFRNVVESSTGWSCQVTNVNAACTVKVEPISQAFTTAVAKQTVTIPSAGAWVSVSFNA